MLLRAIVSPSYTLSQCPAQVEPKLKRSHLRLRGKCKTTARQICTQRGSLCYPIVCFGLQNVHCDRVFVFERDIGPPCERLDSILFPGAATCVWLRTGSRATVATVAPPFPEPLHDVLGAILLIASNKNLVCTPFLPCDMSCALSTPQRKGFDR